MKLEMFLKIFRFLLKVVGIVFLIILVLFFKNAIYDHRNQRDKVNSIVSKIVLNRIVVELEKFYFVCGRYPTDQEGLQVLTESTCGYKFTLKSINFKDGWNNNVEYKLSKNGFHLASLGKNGKVGGEDYEADIDFELSDTILPRDLKCD